jgi:isopropylmalate/homocitrate/citramalate synthase
VFIYIVALSDMMDFRKIEPIFDMREVSQHPSGARYMHSDAIDILERYDEAGGRIALVNHPHSTGGAYDDLEYITTNHAGNVALGAHFRLDYRNGYADDKVFGKVIGLPKLRWVSIFLDASPSSKERHHGHPWEEVLEHTQSLVSRVLQHEKDVRVTTEHAIKTFLSGNDESYKRGMEIIRAAADAGARWFNLPDTTGINDPYNNRRSMTLAVNTVDNALREMGIEDHIINIHAHNDMNTAEEGVMHALMNSNARAADLTLGGLGERNGIGDLYTISYRLANAGVIDYIDVEKMRNLREYSNILLRLNNPDQTIDGAYSMSVVAGTHFSAMYKKTDNGWEFKPYYNPHMEGTLLDENDISVIFTHQSSAKMYEFLLNRHGIAVDSNDALQTEALRDATRHAKEISWRQGVPIPPRQLESIYNAHLRR